MAPSSAKRKRPDQPFSHDDGIGRPSPHRPENLGMAHRGEQHGGRGGRGGGRGGGGSRRPSRQGGPLESANAVPVTPRNALSPAVQHHQAPQQPGTPAADISRTGTPVPRMGTPLPPPVEVMPRDPPAPYAYDYLNDELAASWRETGRQSLLDAAKETGEVAVSVILQELVRSALDGRLSAAECGSVVKQVIADKQHGDGADVQSLFLDTISLLDEADSKNPALLQLVAATDIDPDVIRQELDVPLLQTIALVHSTFARIKARKTTNLLYRQANFNLLREETEGYAKLMTEYFNIAEEASGNREISYNMAEDAFQRIKALVGAFDLDVGRVLDITLDISANQLVKAFGFIIKFYRCSSWWPDNGAVDNVKWEDDGLNAFPAWALPGADGAAPDEMGQLETAKQSRDQHFWQRLREDGMDAFFRLGARNILDYDSVAKLLDTEVPVTLDSSGKEVNEDKRKRTNENRKYMRETRTLPPPGNSDAAQLLGFKLRFYASPARGAGDILTENLIHFTALLIKIGFISLRDVYPHLYPPDEKMSEERTRLEKEKAEKEAKEKPGGGPNALALASALTDDTLPINRNLRDKDRSGGATPRSDKKDDEGKDELPPPANQKIMLLKALLALGTLPEAFFIIGRFPWLMDVDTTLPPYLHRIVRHMLSKVAESVRPLATRSGLGDARELLLDTNAGPDGKLRFVQKVKRPPSKWLQLEEFSERDGVEGRYYYTDWTDTVPVCQTLDDVFLLCNTLLGCVGVKIGQDPAVFGTLLRLAKRSLSEDGSETNRARWLELMRRLLVPALSLSKHNPSLTEEVYQLLMLYPVTTRYNIYAEWFTGRTSRLPELKVAFDHSRAEVKEVLRRVSNDNAKTQARALGKVSYSSPGILITFMINQIESYSNMIPSLIKCTEYFPKLAHDVMTWCLINALSGQGRDRMQADGMLTSSWLQALSQFVAALFSRYTAINPSPILQYLASELRTGNSTNLELFEQVLGEMAGIRSDMEFNDSQVLAMAGGEQLQAQVVQQLADDRHARKSSAKRLIKALAEPRLIGQTLIAIAQERQMYAHHESSKFMPLKVLGNNLDKIQQIFTQYLEVLKTNMTPEEFEAAVPDVVSLIADFGLPPGIAFTICRSAIAHRMGEFEAKKQEELEQKKRRLSNEKHQINGDVDMQESEAKPVPNGHAGTLALKGDSAAVIKAESHDSATPQPNGASTTEESPWHPVLEPIIARLQPVTGDLDSRIKLPFFVTFWTLSLSDVVVYTETYHQEIERLQNQINEISRDRMDKNSSAVHERERRKKELQEIQNKLRAEVKGRIMSYTKLSNRLSQQEKHSWFARLRTHAALDARHINLLQECFLPRAMLSSLDAHYSFLMLKMLHDKGAPGFSTLHLLMHLFRKQELAAVIFQCTALEAQHFGRFLNETLKLIASWHADKATYEKEALGKQKLPGFVTKMGDSQDQPATWSFMDYEMFRRTVFNWHAWLTGALQLCFESGEYMHIRNGIIVLKAVVQVFPALNFHGKNMIMLVDTLSKEDARQDLKLMALSLLGPLKNRERAWVMPQAFRLNDPSKEGKPGSRATSARPETPQPGTGTPKLSATAPDFKPSLVTLTNGTGGKDPLSAVEDGEVQEEKQGSAKGGDSDMKDAPAPRAAEAAPATKSVVAEKEAPKVRTPEPRAVPSAPAKELQRPASKPATPAPTAPRSQPPVNGSTRAEPGRSPSTQPALARHSHDLPSRLDSRASYANKPLPPPPIARPDSRFQGRSDDRYGRLERPSSREQSPPGSRGRTPPGTTRGPPRDERPRGPRDDAFGASRRDAPSPAMHSRPLENRERVNGSMGPPSDKPGFMSSVATAPEPQLTSRPASRPDQAVQPPTDDFRLVNPARAAILSGDHGNQSGTARDSQFADKDRRGERDPKDERAGPVYPQRPEARANVRGPVEPPREPQSSRDPSTDLAPSGPRNGRPTRDTAREIGPSIQQESSYGRLNASQDAPLGPRPPNGPAGRGGRNFTAPALSTRHNDPPMPSPTAGRPPESPAASRPPQPIPQPSRQPTDLRNSGPQADRQSSSMATTTTSAPAIEDYEGLHPSRRPHMQPPPIQTSIQATNGAPSGPSPTSAPPSGPRGAGSRAPAGAPTGPSPATNGSPAGPATPTVEKPRNNRQWSSMINAQLSQSGNAAAGPRGQDVSFRGASSRQNSLQISSAAIAPTPQAIASPMEPPQPRRNDATPRHDGPPGRPESRAETRQDLFQKGGETEGRDGDRSRRREDDRGERHRSSRHASHDRRRDDDQPPVRPPPLGMDDGRDKRAAPPRDDRRAGDERDRRESQSRDVRGSERVARHEDERRPPPNMPGSMAAPPAPPPPPEWERGPRRSRDGPADDGRRGERLGGGGRGDDYRGGRREEERRDGGRGGPPRDEGQFGPDGRKRRHEEVPFEESKRRRSAKRDHAF
ncbi:hypothetical protein LTR36_009414 [Oleoguttula mirabilis]|uniref:THO complex subunit 2 n=1 Tax=Oleoguttula mirabilis TaxID=1507867 RepID=A0AAV9JSL3_9PEZI|nr:hypothetical protein LTR36_009414 [Oleoguttula mirabilis]